MKKMIVIAFAAIGFCSACKHEVTEKTDLSQRFTISDTMARLIQIDTAKFADISFDLELTGEVTFNENNVVNIFPRVSGQVTTTNVTLGDKVTKGQVLGVIHSSDIAGNFSDYNSAVSNMSIAKREMDNAKLLYDEGIAAEKDYTEAKDNYDIAVAAVNKAEMLLKINAESKGSSGGSVTIPSPVDGYIVQKNVSAGTFVRSDNGNNLFTISDLKTLWIYANVYESDLSKIREGIPVKVSILAYPGKVFEGKIDRISQTVDSSSKSVTARIVLENKHMLLKPQMYAKITIENNQIAGENKALSIPSSAVIMQDGKHYVVVYNSKDDLKYKEIGIVERTADRAYITGLNPGDRIISKNQLEIFTQLFEQF